MKLTVGNPEVSLNSNILDVVVPDQLLNNISTGWKEVDMLFTGDGIMPSTVALLTGVPGAGKSTFSVQLADAITGAGKSDEVFQGGICIYNGLEESFYQVRKVVNRLELKNGFIPSYESDVDDMLERCDQIQALNPGKQMFLMIDSLPCLEIKREEGKKGRSKGPDGVQIEAVQKITDWAKKTFAIVFILGHVNKDGDFAGRQQLKHIVDVHLHLDIDKDTRSVSYGKRIAVMEKNRTGTAGLYYAFQIGRYGFTFVADEKKTP